MSEGRRPSRARSAPECLPPLELLPFIDQRNGKYVALERFETVTDEFDVPDVPATMKRLGSLMIYDSQYEASIAPLVPVIKNVHHLAHSKRTYRQHGHASHQSIYREGMGVKAEMFIPLHNAEHFLGILPPVPRNEVMVKRAREQQDATHLYRLGSAVLWLDEMAQAGQTSYQRAEDYILRKGLRGNGLGRIYLPSYNSFLDYLDRCRPGEMGILPDIEELATASLADAVKRLRGIVVKDTVLTAEETTAIIMEASREATMYGKAA